MSNETDPAALLARLDALHQSIEVPRTPQEIHVMLINFYDAYPTLSAALRKALEEVADWRETQRRVMSEDCPTDEKHCTCVPGLKRRISELETALRAANAELAKYPSEICAASDIIEAALARGEE